MWIRNQNKTILIDVNNIFIEKDKQYDYQFYEKDIDEIYKNTYVYKIVYYSYDYQGKILLGVYKTEERALEILNEIQNKLLDVLRNALNKYEITWVYNMPKK